MASRTSRSTGVVALWSKYTRRIREPCELVVHSPAASRIAFAPGWVKSTAPAAERRQAGVRPGFLCNCRLQRTCEENSSDLQILGDLSASEDTLGTHTFPLQETCAVERPARRLTGAPTRGSFGLGEPICYGRDKRRWAVARAVARRQRPLGLARGQPATTTSCDEICA